MRLGLVGTGALVHRLRWHAVLVHELTHVLVNKHDERFLFLMDQRAGFTPLCDAGDEPPERTPMPTIDEKVEALTRQFTASKRPAAPAVAASANGVALPSFPRSRGRRSEAQMQRAAAALEAYIRQNPGSSAEQIGAALKVKRRQIAGPIETLLAGRAIRREGIKRATRYFPAGV